MKISWHGSSTIELQDNKQKAFLNPFEENHFKDVQLVVYSSTDKKHKSPPEGLLVDWPGEYDTAGFAFIGVEFHGKKGSSLGFTFQSPQGNVVWLGDLKEYPNEAFIEALGEVHVLVLPVGGNDVLSAKEAFKLVEEVEPLVIIPTCYGDERDGLQPFLKEMDVSPPEEVSDYTVRKSSFSQDKLELVLLQKK